MKFSDVTEEEWKELAPYYDTCLLPLTGLSGKEPPWEVTNQLERLRDAMDLVEKPFKGRVVTYPAIQYAPQLDGQATQLTTICQHLRTNFSFVIIVTAHADANHITCPDADLIITPAQSEKGANEIQLLIENMWKKNMD